MKTDSNQNITRQNSLIQHLDTFDAGQLRLVQKASILENKEEILFELRSKRTTRSAETCILMILLYRIYHPRKKTLGIPKIFSLVKRYDKSSESAFCRFVWRMTVLIEKKISIHDLTSELQVLFECYESELSEAQSLTISAYILRLESTRQVHKGSLYFKKKYEEVSLQIDPMNDDVFHLFK